MIRVWFIREEKEIFVPKNTLLYKAAIQAGLQPNVPCGGNGTCGKCRMSVKKEDQDYFETVYACHYQILNNLVVDSLPESREHRILTEGVGRSVSFSPDLRIKKIDWEKPVLGEKRSDWDRLKDTLGEKDILPDPELASSLCQRWKEQKDWYVIHSSRQIFSLRKEKGRICFAAFDIGTTTLVGYLLDAETGSKLAVESCLNPQSKFGSDVISRSHYALKHGILPLRDCIRHALQELLLKMTRQAGVDIEDIFQVCIVGNTCMHHLFLGISPSSLVHAPYTPALSEGLILSAAEYGLSVHPKAELLLLPNIAGYVGADTTGCLLTVRPDQSEEITLLLDIGTNGEMVLGNKHRLLTCSTAAGPAFEGAKIECGMRGTIGAIDHVFYENKRWRYTTIGNAPAVGICGSGLIDLIACLLRAGLIDERGRLLNGDSRFVFVEPSEKNTTGVYLSQKDIGEVQLAKAAIAAGIRLLLQKLNLNENQIDRVCIAGAFGTYMDPHSAGAIGIFPSCLINRVQAIGNAAGEGAKLALCNQKELQEIEKLVSDIDFIELATSEDFQDFFMEELEFTL